MDCKRTELNLVACEATELNPVVCEAAGLADLNLLPIALAGWTGTGVEASWTEAMAG